MSKPSHTLPPRYTIRPATHADLPAMLAVHHQSSNASHPFFNALLPQSDEEGDFFTKAFRLGIEYEKCIGFVVVDCQPDDPTATAATVAAEDAGFLINEHGHRLVAFSRWWVPQRDWTGTAWPKSPESIDAELAGPFFGGMAKNRAELMGGREHWFLELLAVSKAYWGCGIGTHLTAWGCEQADKDGLEVYLDASPMGAPLYRKKFGFVKRADIPIPKGDYGEFIEASYVRPVMKA